MDRRFEENNVEDFAGAREGHYFDRKSARKDVDEIAKHVMAFANAAGGKLVVGIEDDGTVTGFKRDKAHSIEGFEQSYLTELSPAPSVSTVRVPAVNEKGEDDQVLVMDVACEESRVVRRRKDGKVALREGDKSVWLDYEQIRALEYDKGEHYFESEVLLDYGIEDVDREALAMYKRALGTDVGDEKLLRSVGALKGGHLTNAGMMLFGESPSVALPQMRIRVLRVDGTELGTGSGLRIVKDRTFDGPLVKSIPEAREFISTQLREFQFQVHGTMEFRTVPEYPEYAWFEGLVNAVTHRDYSIRGEYIRVYIYDDRMLIQSPGKLPNIVTVDNIRHVRFSRNPILARVFTAFDWVRELNEGVDKIYQEMADAGLPEPEYESQDDYYLKLTLRNDLENRIPRMNAGDVGNRVGNVGNHVGNQLSETEERVLALVKSDPKTSARKISDKLEMSVRQAERTLASLRKKGVIAREGGTRGYWKVR
ncbi:ATP-binding protein [Enteroscipio rubneri]|uniref:ATP-binding protein n=1 Tax=Enteroscipio rubneri TaxID=2070686 RepID=UPI00320ABDE8